MAKYGRQQKIWQAECPQPNSSIIAVSGGLGQPNRDPSQGVMPPPPEVDIERRFRPTWSDRDGFERCRASGLWLGFVYECSD